MTSKTLAFLFFIAAVSLKPVPVRVQVNANDHYIVNAGKMTYKSPYLFKSIKDLKQISIFYIHSQESFLFSKTLGATFSNMGSKTDNIPIEIAELTEDKREDNTVYFTGTLEIEHANSNTLENLSVQSILKTSDSLQIFVGELEFFSVLRISLDNHNRHFVSMKKERFPISKQTFKEIREGSRLPDLSFWFNDKKLKQSKFMWTSDKSGLAIVAVKSKEFNSFRFSKDLIRNDYVIRCILLEQNLPFVLSFQKAKMVAAQYQFAVVSQDLFSEEFVCDGVKNFDSVSISRQSQNHMSAVSRKTDGETLIVDSQTLEHLYEGPDAKDKKKVAFDYSVLVSRQNERLDFQLSTRVGNQNVYFKIFQKEGKKFLTLETLDLGNNVVTNTFELPEGKYQRIRPAFILASESGAQLADLKMVRSSRLHVNLFNANDFCNTLTKPFFVNTDYLETPNDDNVSDTGYFLKLTDDNANLRKWNFVHYIDHDGYLKLIIFDSKRAGFLNVNDNDLTISYMGSYQYKRIHEWTKNIISTMSFADLPKTANPKEFYQTNVNFYEENKIVRATTFLINPANPRWIFVNMNSETLKLAKRNLKVKINSFKDNNFAVTFYPVGSFAEVNLDDKLIEVSYKNQKFTTDMFQDGQKRKNAIVIYKKRGECTVLKSLFLGRTVDTPSKDGILVNVGKLSINLSKTQVLAGDIKGAVIISLAGFNSDGMSENQLKNLKISEDGTTCQIPVERDLRFTVNQMELSLADTKRSKNYIVPLPGLQKLQLFKNYKFGQQDQTLFHCFETIKANLVEGKTCVVLAGFINDLAQKTEEQFFGAGANFFNTPIIAFTQKDDLFKFDFGYQKGILEAAIKQDMITLSMGETSLLEARLTKPNIHVKDLTKRYFKFNLYLFINEIEDIKGAITYPMTEGLSIEKFDTPDQEFKFQITMNADANYIAALSKILGRSRLAFAGETFENQKGELTLVIYEQTLFATNRMVNFALQIDDTFNFKSDKQTKFKNKFLNKVNNPNFAKKIAKEVDQATGEPKKLAVTSFNESIPSVNSVCAGEECLSVSVFKGKEAGEYYLISKAGSLDTLLSSGQELAIFDKDSRENIRGFPAVELAEPVKVAEAVDNNNQLIV